MKKILFFSLCMVIASQAFISCSKDETDLIDEYFKLKKERLSTISPKDLPQIAKIYSDAVTFSLDVCDADITLYISTDQNKLTATTNNMHHTWYNFESEHEQYTFTDLTPNTTYYYKVIVDRGYQQFDPTYNYRDEEIVLESPIQSFTTKPAELTINNYVPAITYVSNWYSATDSEWTLNVDFSGFKKEQIINGGDFYSDNHIMDVPIEVYWSTSSSFLATSSNLLYKTTYYSREDTSKKWIYKYGENFSFYANNFSLTSGKTYYFMVVVNGVASEIKAYTKS